MGPAGSIPEGLSGDPPRNCTPGDVEDLNMQQLNLTGYLPFGGGRGTLTLFGKRFDADRFNVNQAPDPNVKRINNGISGDGRQSTVALGKRMFDMKVDYAVNQIQKLTAAK